LVLASMTRVERVEALPCNHMGKVERARLRAWLASETGLSAAA
jgi:acyl-coenzyme A synthetase/AMP-(fatty) acid ligase